MPHRKTIVESLRTDETECLYDAEAMDYDAEAMDSLLWAQKQWAIEGIE